VAVVPPPEVQFTVIPVVLIAVILGAVGLGGRAWGVALTVTPEERVGVVLPFAAQIRKEYWVAGVNPETTRLVPVRLANWAAVQLAGAVAPRA
jgi:hypothetical protein